MNRDNYKTALTKIAWGYVLLYFNFNVYVDIGTLNLVPSWVGVILILQALDEVAVREPSAKLLKPFAFLFITGELILWALAIFDGSINWIWFNVTLSVVTLYFHFQLLTNLSDIARREGSAYWKRIRFFRTYQTILVTVLSFFDIGTITLNDELSLLIIGALVFVMMVGLVWTLFSYRNEPTFTIEIPLFVQYVLDQLTDAGYEAYIVGGCVRDALRGDMPKDWDICTSALPDETLTVFAEQKTIETGLKHGTVTVMSCGNPVEVTTYRIDGEYEDGRHPKKVEFTHSLEEDLARRDFTINAMAYHPAKGIVDLYNGRDDLKTGLIRCVGHPNKRFDEDALRIMRGLRFASVLDFSIEFHTDMAMRNQQEKLNNISKERINVELSKLLLGIKADQIVMNFIEVLEEAETGFQLPQTDLNRLPYSLPARLSEVFPEETERHLRNLKYDNQTVRTASALAALRGTEAPVTDIKEMKKFLWQYGEDIAKLHYERAGVLAQLEEVLEQKPCYRVKDLAVNGGDLIGIGLKTGPEIGSMLNYLLVNVIEENLENETAALLAAAKEAMDHE